MLSSSLVKEVVCLHTPTCTVVVGKREAIPFRMHRFALSSAAAIRSALLPALGDPRCGNDLRQLARRMGGLFIDQQLVQYIAEDAAGLSPRLLVLDLSSDKFLLSPAAPSRRPTAVKPAGAGRALAEDADFERATARAFTKIQAQAKEQLSDNKTLRMISAAMASWAGAHHLGGVPGLVADGLIVGLGIHLCGFEIFEVGRCVASAISLIREAQGDEELEAATAELAQAIDLVGINTFLTLASRTVARGATGPRKFPKVVQAASALAQSGDDKKEEETEQKNWIFVKHQRREPGDLDPAKRAVTELKPVESTARVYERGGELLATVTLPPNGEPVKVAVPVGINDFEVVFDTDFGGAYEIAHQPYSNPFTDETKPPSPGQLYLLGKLIKLRA